MTPTGGLRTLTLLVTLAGVAAQAQAAEPPRRFAVIVANNQSLDEGVTALSYAVDDGAKYFELFRALGARTELLATFGEDGARRHPEAAAAAVPPRRDEVLAAIERAFAEIRSEGASGRQTHFYFVYTGHGNLGPNREGYINLADARFRRTDLYREVLARSPATFNHVVLDACHAYHLVMKKGGADKEGDLREAVRDFLRAEDLASYPNTGVILATSSSNETHEWSRWEAGIFSHELRSGLLGPADVNGYGKVGYAEAAAFVEAANAAIDVPRARLRVFYRAPTSAPEVPLVDLAPLHALPSLEVEAQHADQFHVEDGRGVRVADFHPSAEQAARVALVGQAPFWLRSGDREAVLPSETRVLASQLTFDPTSAPAKGSIEQSFRKNLFLLPFGQTFFRASVAERALLEKDLAVEAMLARRSEVRPKQVAGWVGGRRGARGGGGERGGLRVGVRRLREIRRGHEPDRRAGVPSPDRGPAPGFEGAHRRGGRARRDRGHHARRGLGRAAGAQGAPGWHLGERGRSGAGLVKCRRSQLMLRIGRWEVHMHKLFSVALPLVSLVLAVHCGFRFDNPVEQCPPQGCNAVDAYVQPPTRDAGTWDACCALPPADGGTEDTGPMLWFEPSAKSEFVEFSRSSSRSLAISGNDQPFIVSMQENAAWAATRSQDSWSLSEIGSVFPMSNPSAVGGGSPAAFFGGQELRFAERPADTWDQYLLVNLLDCNSLAGVRNTVGTISLVGICNTTLKLGHWNGDRSSRVQISWQDIEQVSSQTSVRGFWADSQGGLHVLTMDYGAHDLAYLRRPAGGDWIREVVESNDGQVVGALDNEGELAYCLKEEAAAVGSYNVKCVRRVLGQWATRTVFVNSKQPHFWFAGLAFDSANRMHLLATKGLPDGSCCAAAHWVENGSDWQVTDLVRTQGSSELILTELAFDSKGNAHFAVSDGSRLYHVEVKPQGGP
ncbi:MAG TPA: hypothetical protein VGK67_27370 [Myxococcales bacterium]|jgi:hypothetical protein